MLNKRNFYRLYFIVHQHYTPIPKRRWWYAGASPRTPALGREPDMTHSHVHLYVPPHNTMFKLLHKNRCPLTHVLPTWRIVIPSNPLVVYSRPNVEFAYEAPTLSLRTKPQLEFAYVGALVCWSFEILWRLFSRQFSQFWPCRNPEICDQQDYAGFCQK